MRELHNEMITLALHFMLYGRSLRAFLLIVS